MKKHTIWIVKSRKHAADAVIHTTSFIHEEDANLFKIIIDKKHNLVSIIEKQELPSIHENLASACDKWGF